jgi:hypothetical protein
MMNTGAAPLPALPNPAIPAATTARPRDAEHNKDHNDETDHHDEHADHDRERHADHDDDERSVAHADSLEGDLRKAQNKGRIRNWRRA